jgi:ATP-binding cassette subfamily C protein
MIELLRDLARLRPLFSAKDLRKFLLLFALMIAGAVLEAAGIGAIPAFVTLVMRPSALSEIQYVGQWFMGLPDQITMPIFLWAAAGLLVFVILKNAFLTFVAYVQARIVTSQRVRLSARLFRIYQAAPFEWLLQRNSSELIRSLQTDTAEVLNGVMTPALNILMALIMSAFMVALLFLGAPWVTLAAVLVTAVGMIAVTRVFKSMLRRTGEVKRHESKEMIKAIQQGFGSMAEARIIGCEDYLGRIYRNSFSRAAVAIRHGLTIQKMTPYVVEVFTVLGLLIILLLLISGTEELASILPIVALVGVVMVRLKQFAGQIAGALNQVSHSRAFIPAILRDIDELQTIAEQSRRPQRVSGREVDRFESLELDNVRYRYPGSDAFAVDGISLQLAKGGSIALVGTTGCGKSTLVNLVLGLLEPRSGRVLVNGQDIHDDLAGWRAKLGYVPQTTYLIDDTVEANVAFGVPDSEIDRERVWRCLRAARLDGFVEAMPRGVGSIVGERGLRLSGGERQRLGIARALYQEPEVLVLDEATSALDNKTEEEVMSAIQDIKAGRTLIMIAHRLSTVRDCDRLYLLSRGQVIGEGSYDDLLESSEAFQEIALSGNDIA